MKARVQWKKNECVSSIQTFDIGIRQLLSSLALLPVVYGIVCFFQPYSVCARLGGIGYIFNVSS